MKTPVGPHEYVTMLGWIAEPVCGFAKSLLIWNSWCLRPNSGRRALKRLNLFVTRFSQFSRGKLVTLSSYWALI